MGLILRDFECGVCGRVFESLELPTTRWVGCINERCGGWAKKIITFKGLAKVSGESSLPPILARDSGLAREVSPGRDLTPHFEEEREYSKVRWLEKKLPDGRVVRRPSIKIDEPKSRGLHSNLEKDIGREAQKRRK